jgi:hypothetical protein
MNFSSGLVLSSYHIRFGGADAEPHRNTRVNTPTGAIRILEKRRGFGIVIPQTEERRLSKLIPESFTPCLCSRGSEDGLD